MDKDTKRYSDSDLDEFRIIIELKLQRAKSELNYYQEQMADLSENINEDHSDWSQGAMAMSDLELLDGLAQRQRKFIRELESALIRVKQKTYGICTVTGDLIDKRRLIATPSTTVSQAVKNAEEDKNKVVRTEGPKEETPPTIVPKNPPPGTPVKPLVFLSSSTEDDEFDLMDDLDENIDSFTSLDDIADDLGYEEDFDI
jgi:RNA polymerase-binding transcription factor DksA